MIKLIKRVFGYCNCPCHKRRWFVYSKKYRMNTNYENKEHNYITCCEKYYNNVIEPYWEEKWNEYYSSRL